MLQIVLKLSGAFIFFKKTAKNKGLEALIFKNNILDIF